MKYQNIKSYLPCMLLIILLLLPGMSAKAGFIPWDADVSVGDENIKKPHVHRHRVRPVYNAPTAAGYFMIRFFQKVISPQDGPNCRFNPTCSAYGRQAVERYGLIIGGFMAGDRVIRCNPYSPPGKDPLPRTLKGD
ncbi:MAG: membrane protein insertion efficiency factor YidD [Spirochaetota bacterium]